MDLGGIEEAAKLCVGDCVAEVRVEPVIERLLALGECESLLSLPKYIFELLDQQLSVLCH